MIFSIDRVKVWRDSIDSATRLLQDGDYGKAEAMLLDAYEHGKNLFGPNDGNVGLVLLRLAEACLRQGKHQLAAEYAAEVDRIIEHYGLDDPGDCEKPGLCYGES